MATKKKSENQLIKFKDNLFSFVSKFTNNRNALNNNGYLTRKLEDYQLRAIYKTGLANKIVRVKSSYSINNTMDFDSEKENDYYDIHLSEHVRNAVTFMLAFGRSIVVLHEDGADLSQPLPRNFSDLNVNVSVFSGDMVDPFNVDIDLASPRYNKPKFYIVRGYSIHYSRVVDFTYVEPTEFEKPFYKYGGISEFELIHSQLVADGIVERSSSSIVEKNSTIFYKVKGLSDSIMAEKEDDIISYFNLLENQRSIYGATVLDSEDDVMSIAQTLDNLKDVNDISLRRIAMVTDIPLAILIGENVKGLNSTGDNELKIFLDSIKNLQRNYILKPLNELLLLLDRKPVNFKTVQWETPIDTLRSHDQILKNAMQLQQLGEDFGKYLVDNGIVVDKLDVEDFFSADDETDNPMGEADGYGS